VCARARARARVCVCVCVCVCVSFFMSKDEDGIFKVKLDNAMAYFCENLYIAKLSNFIFYLFIIEI